MFHLLLLYLDKYDIEPIYELCDKMQDATIYESTCLENSFSLCKHTRIDCIFLFPDVDFVLAKHFISTIRKVPIYKHTPIILLSSQLVHAFQIFPQWHCCEFFYYPLNQERKEALQHLLLYYHKQCSHNLDIPNDIFQLNTSHGIHSIHYDNILFIEIVLKKTIFHTKTEELVCGLPLYKIKVALHSDYIIQTHRSFIVNLNNISYLDKTKNPWEISFIYTNKKAYVSRNYKKQVLEALSLKTETT